jgi:hypothetical protein
MGIRPIRWQCIHARTSIVVTCQQEMLGALTRGQLEDFVVG